MPYKLSKSGKSVLIRKKGRWVVHKKHPTPGKAKAHLRALRANVKG